MAEKREVNIKEQGADRELTKREKEFIGKLQGKTSSDLSDVERWRNKAAISINQRLGIKRYTSKPYSGAPDIPLPETDKLIKKSTPNLILSATSLKKPAVVELEAGLELTPELSEKIKKAEAGLNLVLNRKETGLFKKISLAADNAKTYGHCLFRTFEDFRDRTVTKVIDLDELPEGEEDNLKALNKEEKVAFVAERYSLDPEDEEDGEIIDDVIAQFNSGERTIEFEVNIISSLPNFEVPLPTKVVVPTYTTEINEAERIRYEFFMSQHELEERMDSNEFRKKDMEKLDFSGASKGSDEDINEQTKQQNSGVTDNSKESDLFRIHMVNTWYKPEASGKFQRWVFVYFADIHDPDKATLQSIPFPYEFEGWDYDKFDNEVKDPRYYDSRGLPEQVRALQEFMERSVNNMLIRDEMNNTPMWEVLSTSEIMDSAIEFGPGRKLPVTQIGTEISAIASQSSVDVSSERIMQFMKATMDEYAGSTDQLFRNATNAGGGKTLGEIEQGIQQSAGPISVDIRRFNEALSCVYQKFFEIMKERLGETLFVDGMAITKEDYNFLGRVRSNGNLEVSDQQLATQKAMARLQVVGQMVGGGVADTEDLFRALQDWLEKDGIKDPDRFSTDPKQILQTQLAQLQQAVQQMQQQAQQLQDEISKGQKTVSRNQKKIDKDIDNATGELTAIEEIKGETIVQST